MKRESIPRLMLFNRNRMERDAVSVIEPAEHFVIFQPEHLNGHQQGFQPHDESIADDQNQYIADAAAHFR